MDAASLSADSGSTIARPDSRLAKAIVLERPFYLIVVLWGERFRHYFLSYCLPSLMAPGNIPALATRQQSKFLIATRPEDWAAMKQAPIFGLMAQHVSPEFIEIPPCPPGKSGCEHMGIGHKLACEQAYRDQAYAAIFTPDAMLADGGLARLQELARSGVELAITAALRFGEEPLFAHLKDIGVPMDLNDAGDGALLSISSRQMVKAAIKSFHSHSASCEWGSSYFPQVPHCAWWRVPDEDGVLLHSLSFAPLLIDYQAFSHHDTSALEDWTLDGDYLYKNIDDMDRVYIVQDSDELFLVSWAPLSDRRVRQYSILKPRPLGRLVWAMQFKAHFESSVFDPFKRKLFFEPIRWHSGELNGNWDLVERRAMKQLQSLVAAPGSDTRSAAGKIVSFSLTVLLVSVQRLRKTARRLQARRQQSKRPQGSS